MRKIVLLLILAHAFTACKDEPVKSKGFSVNKSSPEETNIEKTGLAADSLQFDSRPNRVLLSADPIHRLVPIYKLNMRVSRKDTTYYTGSNHFHSSYWSYGHTGENNWNNNFMPGFEATYGYNMINVNYHNVASKETKPLFENPVLINTLYYPTFSNDTLNGSPVKRNYYMVSAYNEDSNNDGYINSDDLRRFFLFDLDGTLRSHLTPANFSVRSSQYDPANDYMYVFAMLDEDNNGQADATEPAHVFWINLSNPDQRGRLY